MRLIMARSKKIADVEIEEVVGDIKVEDIIDIRMFMADKFKKQLEDLSGDDPKSNECENLRKKIKDLLNIDNALDAYNEIKGNIPRIPKIKLKNKKKK